MSASILDLLAQDGIHPVHMAGTHGGEFASPCPVCGGRDRFRTWPKLDKSWCRGCRKVRDCIQYLRDVRGMSYPDACKYLGKEPKPMNRTYTQPARSHDWKPREIVSPAQTWIEKAAAFAKWAKENLWKTPDILEWLKAERGLTKDSIERAFLGWNPQDICRNRKDWGLKIEDEKKTRLSLPAGLVIPHFLDGAIHRLRIRRQNPGPEKPPYHIVAGSCTAPMVFGDSKVFIVVESELDAILLNQHVGDLAGVIALGNAQSRPDEKTMKILEGADLILIALDSDEAGVKAAWLWWTEHFYQARRWPPVDGKDPGEMWKAGVDLHEWVEAGIEEFSAASKHKAVFDTSVDIPEFRAMVQGMPYRDFVKAHLAVHLHSELVGDFYVVSDERIKAMVEHKTPRVVVYLPDEILHLMDLTPEEAAKVHMVKKIFNGVFVQCVTENGNIIAGKEETHESQRTDRAVEQVGSGEGDRGL